MSVAASAPVVARGLTKRFGEFVAVNAVDFEVRHGEAFGFLGPNGAGKSSTMRMIGCVSPPSAGELRVLGRDPVRDAADIKSRLGVVPQSDTLDDDLTVFDNVAMYGRFFGLSWREARSRAGELLEFAELTDRADARCETLSGGMKRRLTIARGLVNRPELMLLDEPTTGLDPQARHLLWDRLYRLKADGVTLILTTHFMDEAEQLCDRLAVMDGGRFVAEGTPAELMAAYTTREVVELRFPVNDPVEPAALSGVADRVEALADRTLLFTGDGDATLAAVHRHGFTPERVVVRRGTLEDVFLRLTGRTLIES